MEERIPARIGKGIAEVMGQAALLKGLPAADLADQRVGVPTVRDILYEFEKAGRDPRPESKWRRSGTAWRNSATCGPT